MDVRILRILRFAQTKHFGQTDKSGKDYIFHPISVALLCTTESARCVALLHDVLEDTDATVDDLWGLGLTADEIDAVILLTKPHQEDYMHYIKRVACHPIAREVKMCDLTHNMDLSRLPHVTEKDIRRVAQYKKAYDYLCEVHKRKDLEVDDGER